MSQPIATGPQSAVEMIAAQRAEYETYVAITDITIGNARAFNAGDPVPASTVERFDMVKLGLAAKRDSEEAQPILATATPVDPDELLAFDLASQAAPDTGMRMGQPTVTAVPESTEDGAVKVPAAKTTSRAKSEG